jgi:hypothetical protein
LLGVIAFLLTFLLTFALSGPYTAPYFVATGFSHLVLMASGIGITPALGVMDQYPGNSRTKVFIWTVRSRNMLKFFAPLMKDVHVAIIFYTGKEKLTPAEVDRLRAHGRIFVQQSRPESLTGTIYSIIQEFEEALKDRSDEERTQLLGRRRRSMFTPDNAKSMMNLVNFTGRHEQAEQTAYLDTWCLLYCGGSTFIRDELESFAKKKGIGWNCELFDW